MIRIGPPLARRKRIPVTPLIDVIFILVMFFLLSSSFGIWRPLEVALGVNAGQDPAQEPRQEFCGVQVPAVLISLKGQGGTGSVRMTVNGQPVSLNGLQAELNRLAGLGAGSAVLIPSADVEFQQVVDVLDAARASDIHKVSLTLD